MATFLGSWKLELKEFIERATEWDWSEKVDVDIDNKRKAILLFNL